LLRRDDDPLHLLRLLFLVAFTIFRYSGCAGAGTGLARISIIMVTHEVSSILRVANRIVFLDKGVVVFEGPLDEALHSTQPAVNEFFSVMKNDNIRQLLQG